MDINRGKPPTDPADWPLDPDYQYFRQPDPPRGPRPAVLLAVLTAASLASLVAGAGACLGGAAPHWDLGLMPAEMSPHAPSGLPPWPTIVDRIRRFDPSVSAQPTEIGANARTTR